MSRCRASSLCVLFVWGPVCTSSLCSSDFWQSHDHVMPFEKKANKMACDVLVCVCTCSPPLSYNVRRGYAVYSLWEAGLMIDCPMFDMLCMLLH